MTTQFGKILFLLPVLLVGCGDEKEKMGKARVTLGNATKLHMLGTPGALPAGATGKAKDGDYGTYALYPAKTMGFRMVQIYLVEDIKNSWDNAGTVSYIWINPGCTTETSEDDGSVTIKGSCGSENITSYFELARTTAEVNAELNSQALPVKPLTYRYIRVQVCDNTSTTAKNIRFSGQGVASPTEATTGDCVLSPVAIDPPLTIGEDETVEVSLAYDLSTALIDRLYNIETGIQTAPVPANTSKECAYTDDGTSNLCFNDIVFTPTVSK